MNLWGCIHEQSSVHTHGIELKAAVKRIAIIVQENGCNWRPRLRKIPIFQQVYIQDIKLGGGLVLLQEHICAYVCACMCVCVCDCWGRGRESEGRRKREGVKQGRPDLAGGS